MAISQYQEITASDINSAISGIVTQSITDGDTTHAPSADAVYDAVSNLTGFVPTSRTINGKALSSDISLGILDLTIPNQVDISYTKTQNSSITYGEVNYTHTLSTMSIGTIYYGSFVHSVTFSKSWSSSKEYRTITLTINFPSSGTYKMGSTAIEAILSTTTYTGGHTIKKCYYDGDCTSAKTYSVGTSKMYFIRVS